MEGHIYWFRVLARIVVILWAAFWNFFAAGSVMMAPHDQQGIVIAAVFSLIMLGSAVLPWWKENWGGLVLCFESILVVGGYPVVMSGTGTAYLFIILTMGLPPLLAGGLFIYIHRVEAR